MKHAYGVGIVLLLALGCMSKPVAAQSGQTDGRPRIQLGKNYPNPFNPETRIPFTLGDGLFQGGKSVVVTIRIYNQLHQLVAIPQALNHPSGNGARLNRLEYAAPGDYVAYWDGYDALGKKVASGLYFARLEVNGERSQPIKLIVDN
ncbi:MAG: hypothetical protein ABIV28_00265 [Longimicrobiales bacterium]